MEGIEERACACIAISTIVCFSIGMFYELGVYILTGMYLLVAANCITLTVYISAGLLFMTDKLRVAPVLFASLLATQGNISLSLCYDYVQMAGEQQFAVPHDLMLGFIVCILASLCLDKKQVYLLCLMPAVTLLALLAVQSPTEMAHYLPGFCLAYLSPPLLLTHLRLLLWETLRVKERLVSEKKSLCRLAGMNEAQWDLLIDIVQAPHTSRQQTEELFGRMQKVIGDRLMIKAKRLLASEELMERINEKRGLSLTANEVRLCCLILEDKSVRDISRLLYINESSVRANRSRIRKKLNLAKGTNLKAHLLMLVGKERSGNT